MTDYEVFDHHRVMCLGIPDRFFDNAADNLGIQTDQIESLLRSSHYDDIVQRMVKECWSEGLNSCIRGPLFVEGSMMALATRILTLAIGARTTKNVDGGDKGLSNAEFDVICQYVDANIDSNLRMKLLGDLLQMNEYAFSAALKARTGTTPYQWVIERRLSRAKQLLRASKMSLAEVALAVGFSSQAHMTTLFSQKMGVTPAEFRSQI